MSVYRSLKHIMLTCIPSNVVGLTLVPDGTRVRVEHRRNVDITLLELGHWHCSSELEEDAEERDEDEEALGEHGGVARTHS